MDDRVSRYQFGQTHWSLVFAAGKKAGDGAEAARQQLLIRYHEAVYRYLLARLGDANVAGELFSRFAERVLELHPFLERADPEKGRFRDYLRSVLQRMIVDYYREQQKVQKQRRPILEGGAEEPSAPAPTDHDEEAFRKVWTEELLNQAWRELEARQQAGGQPYYALLLYKAQQPQVRSEAMAQHFTQTLGRPMSAANVRQLLHRGQELLNDLLIVEVARTLRQEHETVTVERIEEELLQLQLLDKPRKDALARFRQKND